MELASLFQVAAEATADFCATTAKIWAFVGSIVNILQIGIPIIIVLLATIDLGKAVMAGEDKKIKEAQKMLLMRLIYGVAIFFVVVIVKVVFGLIGEQVDSGDANICFRCATGGNCPEADVQ